MLLTWAAYRPGRWLWTPGCLHARLTEGAGERRAPQPEQTGQYRATIARSGERFDKRIELPIIHPSICIPTTPSAVPGFRLILVVPPVRSLPAKSGKPAGAITLAGLPVGGVSLSRNPAFAGCSTGVSASYDLCITSSICPAFVPGRINLDEQDLERRAEHVGLVLDRRSVLKGALGLGGALVVGSAVDRNADAARRGYGGPQLPSSSGGGFGWWVDIAVNYRGNDFDYSIRQSAGDNPFAVMFGNLSLGPIYIDIDDTERALEIFSGYDQYIFQTPGIHRFRAWQPAGTFGGIIGHWAELNIAG